MTAVGGGLRRRAGGLEEIPLVAAGLTDDGRPWISGRSGPTEVELRIEDEERWLEVPDAPAVGALRVVAVEPLTVLRPGDEPDAVFDVAWELTSTTGTPAGTVLLAASGPPGPAVIELSWN